MNDFREQAHPQQDKDHDNAGRYVLHLGEHLKHLNFVTGEESHFAQEGFTPESFRPIDGQISTEQYLVLSFFRQEVRNVFTVHRSSFEFYRRYKDRFNDPKMADRLVAKVAEMEVADTAARQALEDVEALLPTLEEVTEEIKTRAVGWLDLEQRQAELARLEEEKAELSKQLQDAREESSAVIGHEEELQSELKSLNLNGRPIPDELRRALDESKLLMAPYRQVEEAVSRSFSHVIDRFTRYYQENGDNSQPLLSATAASFLEIVADIVEARQQYIDGMAAILREYP